MIHLSFYKFVKISDIEILRDDLLEFCKENSIKGTILLANEGINGMLAAEQNKIENFKSYMRKKEEFKDIFFKEQESSNHGYKKILVKIKPEIITFKQSIDMENTGDYLKPDELKSMYENNEDFAIIDMRNDFEYDIGHFHGAIKINSKKFSELPEEIELIKDRIKDKKIVTYCTGGVRCEKGTAYLKQLGYKDIYQLDGGIINYGKEIGGSFWNGKCFVFDDRREIELISDKQN